MTIHTAFRVLGFFALLASILFGLMRVAAHQAHELDAESDFHRLGSLAGREGSTSITSRLYGIELKRGETATFELCFDDPLDPARWKDAFSVLVWGERTQTLGLNIPLDEPHLALVKRSESRSCLPLGSGEIPQDDRYVIDLYHPADTPIPEELLDVHAAARVLIRLPLGRLDAIAFFLTFLTSAFFVLTLPTMRRSGREKAPSARETVRDEARPTAKRSKEAEKETEFEADRAGEGHAARSERRAASFALGGSVFGLALIYAIFAIPRYSSLEVAGKSLLVIAVQLTVPLMLARAFQISPAALFALVRPRGDRRPVGRMVRYFAPIAAGVALSFLARQLLFWIPATGEAPITTFIAAPSGALAFALMGLLSPLAEELFFRGFVYGAFERFGTAMASLMSVVLFAALHYVQTSGSLGAFVAIALAGCLFTALRALTGSVHASVIAHFAYNAALALTAFT